MKKYDYLIVGSGLSGAVFAQVATANGKSCLVVEKRDVVGGNIYTENIQGINVHKYGAHIFHTNDLKVWDYVNKFTNFNNFINCPIANFHGELYNLPFNMNTFHQMWGVTTPEEARAKISETTPTNISQPANLEQKAISLVGNDIYTKLVKEYTEKQWGRKCTDLPPEIINRLPVRFEFNNNYFNAKYQGIPIGGYTKMIEQMLNNIDVKLSTDYFANRSQLDSSAHKVVFTGMIDEYYDYKFGQLEYRSLHFDHQIKETNNFQGNAVINYTSHAQEYTRVIEHRFFEETTSDKTIVTYEYPKLWTQGSEPFYPINDEKNNRLYSQYKQLADSEENLIFAGRLGTYKYYDMDVVISETLKIVEEELAIK